MYSYNVGTTTRQNSFLHNIDVFPGGVGAIADNGPAVCESAGAKLKQVGPEGA